MEANVLSKKRQFALIFICYLAYTIAQTGRYSYNANVTLIMDKFSVDHTAASVPMTLFFFAYGIGQIIVGIFCHKFSRRFLVVSALVVSAAINLAVFFGAEFIAVKYLWLLNGFVQANLWPVLLLLLRENVSAERIPFTMVTMAVASTGGRFLSTGLCALLATDVNIFMYCFLLASLMMLFAAVAFFFFTMGVKKPEITEKTLSLPQDVNKKADAKSVVLLVLLCEFSLTSYAISGGLQSWIPAVLKENYGLSDSISIFMSVFLPLCTFAVSFAMPYLNKKFANYTLLCLLTFVIGTILLIAVIPLLNVHWLPVIVLFTVEAMVMTIAANTTTIQVPLTFKGKFDAGFLAGITNGACYVGTALATYVLGAMADTVGWTGSFILLTVIAAVSVIIALLYLVVAGKKSRVSCE